MGNEIWIGFHYHPHPWQTAVCMHSPDNHRLRPTLSRAHSPSPTSQIAVAHLQSCYTHYAFSCCGPNLLAWAGSSIFLVPSIRSNTEETGPRHQWKCFTNYTVAKEMNFMGINLERLLQHIFGLTFHINLFHFMIKV